MKRNVIDKVVAWALSGVAVMAAVPAFAADGSDRVTFRLTGTLTPAACTVSFVGGGSIDYGDIPAPSLSSSGYTALDAKTKSVNVVCNAMTNAYISVIDNRGASALDDSAMQRALGGASGMHLFGLGMTGSPLVKIGAYTISMGPATTTSFDGTMTAQPAVLSSPDKRTWVASATPVFMAAGGAVFYSTGGMSSNPTPVQAKTFVIPLTVKAALNSTTNMPVSARVALDGSATFTVVYQ